MRECSLETLLTASQPLHKIPYLGVNIILYYAIVNIIIHSYSTHYNIY